MKCKYCNADVSPAEITCPKCHHSVMEKNPRTQTEQKKKRLLTIGVAAIAVIFIVTTIGMMVMSQQSSTSNVKQETAQSTASGSLDITYDLLMERFNNNANVKQEKILMKSPEKGSTFSYNLADSILLSGSIDPKTKKLQELKMLARPASKEDTVKMVTAIGVLVESLFPSDANNVRQAAFDALGFKKGSNLQEADNTFVQDNIKFQFTAVKDTGYVFTISDKDAQ